MRYTRLHHQQWGHSLRGGAERGYLASFLFTVGWVCVKEGCYGQFVGLLRRDGASGNRNQVIKVDCGCSMTLQLHAILNAKNVSNVICIFASGFFSPPRRERFQGGK